MLRTRSFVLLLIGGVLLVGAGVAWWMGPHLAYLAFFAEEREQPVLWLHFTRSETTQQETLVANSFAPALTTVVQDEGGQVLGRYKSVATLEGALRDDFDLVQVSHFDRGADLVQLLTSTPFNVLIEVLEDTPQRGIAGPVRSTAADALMPSADGFVLWLLAGLEDREQIPQALRELLAQLEAQREFDAQQVWQARLLGLDEHGYGVAVMIATTDTDALLAYLRRPAQVTQRALVNAQSKHLSVSVFARR